jgi:hypothetical protein
VPSIPSNPAFSNVQRSASSVPSWKNIGQTSEDTRASTIGKISAHPQWRRSPHTAATARPPGASTRCIAASARSGSGTYISPSAQSTTSKDPSGRSSDSASIRRKRAFSTPRAAATVAASCVIRSEMSVPTTDPDPPTASAAGKETSPVPQATSSTRSPGRSAAISSSRCCAGQSWRFHAPS